MWSKEREKGYQEPDMNPTVHEGHLWSAWVCTHVHSDSEKTVELYTKEELDPDLVKTKIVIEE